MAPPEIWSLWITSTIDMLASCYWDNYIPLHIVTLYNLIIYFQHNMATAVDKDAIKEAYTEVMADNNGIEW